MLKSYLKIALRTLQKQKLSTLINVVGLAVGIAACLLMFLYVRDEVNYDAFHENRPDLYRLVSSLGQGNGASRQLYGRVPMPMGPTLEQEYPEIRQAVRFWSYRDVVRYADQSITEQLTFTDAAIFDAFSFPLHRGDPASALRTPDAVVLSESTARRYFGEADPLGQRLSIKLGEVFYDVVVTGVAARLPGPSSIDFDFLLPFARVEDVVGKARTENWRSASTHTYVHLVEGAESSDLEAHFPAFVARHIGADFTRSYQYRLQPLREVHLDPRVTGGMKPASNPAYSYILGGIALLVLLTACINFMTLSIAGAAARSREIGVRKVVGAQRRQLMQQFWCEALLMSLLALLLGLGLAELFLPLFNELANKELAFDAGARVSTLAALLGVTLLTGVLAGSYPALVLSGFHPVETLKGRLQLGGANPFTRTLMVMQFALSVFLIVSTLVMAGQLDFLKTKNLGLDADQVVVIPTHTDAGAPLLERFRSELAGHPSIAYITGSDAVVGRAETFSMGYTEARGEQVSFPYLFRAEYDYLATFGLELAAGRDFSPQRTTDATASVIVNETLVQSLGWEAPLGETLRINGAEVNVIGVVKDFHFQSLHHSVEPAVLHLNPSRPIRHLIARLHTDDLPATLAVLRGTWHEIAPGFPFDYAFLDADFDRQYRAEERWSRIVRYASFFAILIACMGLFGLAALAVTRRTKEIGIRKAMGASASNVVVLLSSRFVRLVLVAAVLACPAAYLVMHRWLNTFAYRIEIQPLTFVLAGGLVLLVALLTVSFQSIKAALIDPVESLRYE
ncbi:MAG: ABC transporter permease [Rhodothermales bacterium]